MSNPIDARVAPQETVRVVHRFGGNAMVVDLEDYLGHRRTRFANWHLCDGSTPDILRPSRTVLDRRQAHEAPRRAAHDPAHACRLHHRPAEGCGA